jgi:hypothetical protein
MLIQKLIELIKTYTIFASVGDTVRAKAALDEINTIRLALGIDASMREIYFSQVNVPVNTKSLYFSRNDTAFTVKQGLGYLENGVTLSMINQGLKRRTITREPVAWQQLFATVQSLALGQQTMFDLPESLRFGENQSLNFTVQGQTTAGYIFLHGATLKDNLEDIAKADLQSEYLDTNGETKYLPETQLVPLEFIFPSNTTGTYATAPNGNENIFSLKNERSVLLTHVSATAINCRLDKLTDEGRNQTLAERVEMAGVASNYQNAYTTFYPLPYPHLLRKGDRLKAVIMNGSPMQAGGVQAANAKNVLCFKGITL